MTNYGHTHYNNFNRNQQHPVYMPQQMQQNQYTFKDKVQNFKKSIARKQRQQIFARKRLELQRSKQQHPLISSSLQKYWNLSAREIGMSQQEIFDTLDNLNPQELSLQDHEQLCTDLLYLLTTHKDFTLPYNFQFKKDGSPYTAAVVAYALYSLTDEEISYWITYMNEDTKSFLYLQIQCQEETYERWIQNLDFMDECVSDWGYVEEAESMLAKLLGTVSDIEDFVLYESVWKRIFSMSKQKSVEYTPTMFVIMSQLMMHFMINVPEDQKKLEFHFIKIIFNEALIKIYQTDKQFDLGGEFMRLINILMEQAREHATQLFVRQSFVAMSEILLKNFHLKFVNPQSQHYLKSIMKEQDVSKIKSQFISDLINICVNYLRISHLYQQNSQIIENLLIIIDSQKEPIHQANFSKLLNLNSAKVSKSNKNLSHESKFPIQNYSSHHQVQYQI